MGRLGGEKEVSQRRRVLDVTISRCGVTLSHLLQLCCIIEYNLHKRYHHSHHGNKRNMNTHKQKQQQQKTSDINSRTPLERCRNEAERKRHKITVTIYEANVLSTDPPCRPTGISRLICCFCLMLKKDHSEHLPLRAGRQHGNLMARDRFQMTSAKPGGDVYASD